MKIRAFFLILSITCFQCQLFAIGMKNDSLKYETENIDSLNVEEEKSIEHNDDEESDVPIKVEKDDTTFITLGKKRIKIFEEDGETSVKIEEMDKTDKEKDEYQKDYRPWKNFKGHWAGFGVGPNNYLNSSNSFDLSEEDQFMEINQVKSWNFNINFAQYSIGLGSDKIGITTGMGIEWCNYHFSDTNTIEKSGGEIIAKATPENTTKNRLQTTYLTIPLIVEFQFPNNVRKNRFYISAGVISGIKLFSNTRVKFVKEGNKQKEKYKSDYYLNSIRYGITARVGYKDFGVYCNYYLTPLFLDNHGPELYPITAGIMLNF
jgi:hypothetical protein